MEEVLIAIVVAVPSFTAGWLARGPFTRRQERRRIDLVGPTAAERYAEWKSKRR